MLSDREAQTGAPREPDVVGSFNAQSIQDCGGVGNPCGQRVGGDVVPLVAPILATVVREDEPEVFSERLGERRGLRVLERIREAGVEKNRWVLPPESSNYVRRWSMGFVAKGTPCTISCPRPPATRLLLGPVE
jgi:hypothetical protein